MRALGRTIVVIALGLGAHTTWAVDAGPPPDDDAPAPVRTGDELAGMVDVALRSLARARNTEALARLAGEDRPGALAKLREAYALDGRDPEIVNNLAYVLLLLGNRAEAEAFLREALTLDPQRTTALLNLADLVADAPGDDPARLAEAATLLTRARELRGNLSKLIRKQAQIAARRGRFEEAERFWREAATFAAPAELDEVLVETSDFYRDFGREGDALAALRRAAGPAAQERVREIELDQAARRLGWTRPGPVASAHTRRQVERARALAREARPDLALALLQRTAEAAPRDATVQLALGDLHRQGGRREAAELAYLRAAALDPASPEPPTGLGELYLAWPRPEEASFFLARALEMRPDRVHLRLPLARAHQAAGDPASALRQVERLLSQGGDGDRAAALALQRDLSGLLAEAWPSGARAAPEEGAVPPPPLVAASNRARVLLAQGENEAAMRELRKLPDAERGPVVLDLEARILRASGRTEEAAAAWEASLAMDPAQPVALLELGTLRLREGRPGAARALWERAEAQGAAAAMPLLAGLDAGEDRGWLHDSTRWDALADAEARLARYVVEGGEAASEAAAQLERVRSRVHRLQVAAAMGLTAAIAILLWVAWWRRGGSDLGAFLARHPEAGPDVQGVLSAIRHEVLKHNTLVLTGLVDAIERGEPAGEKARWCHASLFGDGRGEAVAHRLQAYAERLRALGRAHRVRLNLERRDPALSALLAGFRTLARVAPLLRRVDDLGPWRRRRLLAALRHAARLLNVEGYEAVRSLLDRLRVLEVDEGLLRSLYDRVCREPGRAGAKPATLALEVDPELPLPVAIAIPRHAFADIVTNLVRNALQATVDGPQPAEIGLALGLETDPVTGLERVTLAVRDRSPRALDAATLHGRDIADGLGLTADLVSRFEGTLDVRTPDGPWAKAVVLKLPRLAP